MNIQYPVLKRNGQLQYGNRPVKIVLHHPVFCGSPEELNNMEISNTKDPMIMSGYHFYVRKDGSVYGMRPVEAIGAHCYGQNATSIGITFEGNFMVDEMSQVQFNAGVELCKYLMQQYPGIKEIGGHKKYYNTDCPGTNFPLDKMIAAAMGSTQSSPVVANTSTSIGLIKLWDSGAAVKDIQEKLIKLGYSLVGGADGIFGQSTFDAVEHFQVSHGLSVDGIVGPNTLAALNSAANTFKPDGGIKQVQQLVGAVVDGIAGQETLSKCPELSVGSQGDIVKWLQYCLRVNVDGIFGIQTKIALQNWQASRGLAADGICGSNTWKKLLCIH